MWQGSNDARVDTGPKLDAPNSIADTRDAPDAAIADTRDAPDAAIADKRDAPDTAGTSRDAAADQAQAPPSSNNLPALADLPLRTRGRYIVDRHGNRVKLASVNWYGASDQKLVPSGLDVARLSDIAAAIRQLGFNSVRLPFSNQMLHAPSVDPAAVAKNPDLVGLSPLAIYDRAVEALTQAGLLVIINNHTTHPIWCCNFDDDGLWYTSDHSEDMWLADWKMLAARYRQNLRVIGADLRNEVRIAKTNGLPLPRVPSWAGATNDWRAAAEKAGAVVLEANPNLLVVVEGVNFPRIHLQGVASDPIRLPLPRRLVYAAHNYAFIGPDLNTGAKYGEMDWPTFKAQMDKEWGYVIDENKTWTAPVWVSEFGEGTASTPWFENIVRYLREGDFDFAYWAVNPGPKPDGGDEPFGLLARDWKTPLADFRTRALTSLQVPVRGPGVEASWPIDPNHHFDVLTFSDWDTQQAEPPTDWQPGAFKAACEKGGRVVGLSTIARLPGRAGHNVLCTDWQESKMPGPRVVMNNENRDSSNATARTQGQDWAAGFSKLTCADGHRIVGLAQQRTSSGYQVAGLLCEPSNDSATGPCHAVALDDRDDRRSSSAGDWDSGGYKGQCADDEHVAGISQRAGAWHSLLCCAR